MYQNTFYSIISGTVIACALQAYKTSRPTARGYGWLKSTYTKKLEIEVREISCPGTAFIYHVHIIIYST